MTETNNNVLDYYIEHHHPDVDINNENYRTYYDTSAEMLMYCNFMIFPKSQIIEQRKGNVCGRVYECDLVVHDKVFGKGFITKTIKLDQVEHLRTYNDFKNFVELQDPKAELNVPGKDRSKFLNLVLHNMINGYIEVFGVNTLLKIGYLGFSEDSKNFKFSNGILDLMDGSFEKNDANLSQKIDIDISYPVDQVDSLTLQQSLVDLQSLEEYISKEETISKLVLGYLIAGIYRGEYKSIKNEFPFLGTEGYTGFGKTSLLNFLSWIVGFNWGSVTIGDSEYALEVGMDSVRGYFYFIDEIQKVSRKFLNLLQASYNSGKNHKGGAEGDWSKIKEYNKDCSLICTGEILPYHDEAFLNRFIILNPREAFAVKKSVNDSDEFKKYYELTGNKVETGYLTTDQIKTLATEYYRPRFMCVLKNKNSIDFMDYHKKAQKIIDETVSEEIDIRQKNNLSVAVAGCLALYGENVNEQDVKFIIQDYFERLFEFRKGSVVSGKMLQYIVENNLEFTSRVSKVTGHSEENPMIYLKNSEKEQGLLVQVDKIVRYIESKLKFGLDIKHINQQFRELIDLKESKTRSVKVACGDLNVYGTFIPFSKIEDNQYLQQIRDITLSNMDENIGKVQHIHDGEDKGDMYNGVQPTHKVMSDDTLKNLIKEMEESKRRSEYFNKDFEGTDDAINDFLEASE